MSKIEIKNVYKIFGNTPSEVLPMVKSGANKEEVEGRGISVSQQAGEARDEKTHQGHARGDQTEGPKGELDHAPVGACDGEELANDAIQDHCGEKDPEGECGGQNPNASFLGFSKGRTNCLKGAVSGLVHGFLQSQGRAQNDERG